MNPSPPSQLCPYFGECGGCHSQDVPYAEQLERKGAALAELFGPFWGRPVPVTPSPSVWHYRNRMDFSFGRKQYPEPPPKGFQRETVLGFKRKGKWYWTLDLEECRIAPEGVGGLLEAVRGWARARNLPAFNSRSKDGFLRILLVRQGVRTGQRMVVLITSSRHTGVCLPRERKRGRFRINQGELDAGSFLDAVHGSFPATSVQHAVFRGAAEITAADEIEVLDGPPVIEEELRVPDGAATRDLRFRISPFSFFQTNTLATEILYGTIRERVRDLAPETLYDLYGGSGGIALTCSDLVDEVVSVESVAEATTDGVHNARRNGVDNVTFHTAKVEHYLRDAIAGPGTLAANGAVIADPPRAGLHPKALRRLVTLAPPHLLYVACKPQVLASQDLPALVEAYRLVELEAVDLFPHTPHVEVLARFERK